jgi:hypothetical protein
LVHGACNAFQSISPKDVYFFDDLQHTDLQMNLAEQYYCVPSYRFHASFYRLSEIYANAINEAKVDTNMLLINVIDILEVGGRSDVTTMLNTNVYDIIFLFEKKIEHTAAPSDLPPPKDSGYRMMMDAIDEISHRHIKMSLISKKRHTCRKRRYTIRK